MTSNTRRRNAKSEYQECTCKMDKSFKREMCIKFDIRKICIAGNQCDNSDLDFHNAEDKRLPVFISMCSDEGRDDYQQLKPKGSHASFATTVIAVTILMLSILFSRVSVNVLVFVLRVVFYVTRYMYDSRRRGFALSANFATG